MSASDRWVRLSRRLEDDSSFLAASLAVYALSEGLDDAALAARLGCDLALLPQLRWCLCPRTEAEHFRLDVLQVADRFGVSADVLASVVRRAAALGGLRWSETHGTGYLMAARDRTDEAPGANGDADRDSDR